MGNERAVRTTRSVASTVTPTQDDAQAGTTPPVVALVGSAGSLRPFQDVLAALPAGFPAAIVVVMHLQPARESVLASILDRGTALPVKQAEAGEALEPGRVYVAPPDAHLLVTNG